MVIFCLSSPRCSFFLFGEEVFSIVFQFLNTFPNIVQREMCSLFLRLSLQCFRIRVPSLHKLNSKSLIISKKKFKVFRHLFQGTDINDSIWVKVCAQFRHIFLYSKSMLLMRLKQCSVNIYFFFHLQKLPIRMHRIACQRTLSGRNVFPQKCQYLRERIKIT